MFKIEDVYPCPICAETSPCIKEWEIKGRVQAKGKAQGAVDKKRTNTTVIKLYRCPKCEKTFRKGFPKGGEKA